MSNPNQERNQLMQEAIPANEVERTLTTPVPWSDVRNDRTTLPRYGTLPTVVQRRVTTLEREVPRTVDLAKSVGIDLEYLGIGPIPDGSHVYVGETSDWVVGPAQEKDTRDIPKDQRRIIDKLDKSGVHMPILYLGHEIKKGTFVGGGSTGSLVPVAPDAAQTLVGPVPPPASSVELAQRMSDRARQVFVALGAAVAAPFVLVGAAAAATVGALATLDPVILGAVPAVRSRLVAGMRITLWI